MVVMMNSLQRDAKAKLLDAALSVIRSKGYSATTVDELCAAAKVTKGAFFHHFKSKEQLGVAAADHWTLLTGSFFEAAPYHLHADPLNRVLGYIELRKAILQGEVSEFTCLVGTMVQETYESSPSIREACSRSILSHAAVVETDIDECMLLYGMKPDWTAKSLALYIQAVIQGAFILAKAIQSPLVAADCIDHLHRHVKELFPTRSRSQ
jgi:TetR/AcrR family transcriptional regulator, transcriptional repressor for nem operon